MPSWIIPKLWNKIPNDGNSIKTTVIEQIIIPNISKKLNLCIITNIIIKRLKNDNNVIMFRLLSLIILLQKQDRAPKYDNSLYFFQKVLVKYDLLIFENKKIQNMYWVSVIYNNKDRKVNM